MNSRTSGLVRCLIILCVTSLASVGSHGAKTEGTAPLKIGFDNMTFIHRWSQNGQNEFTPTSETDLSKWNDMMTINVLKNARNGEQLAEVANGIVGNYQSRGKIIRTDAKPRTQDSPAEYLIVAVLGTPELLEAAFTRVVLRDGVGYAVVRSHRIYGKSVGPAMSSWLEQNGPRIETTLMAWSELPARSALERLPQSK